MKYTLVLAFAALSLSAGIAAAQETAFGPGLRDPDFKSYSTFAKGIDTFEDKRTLAPRAALLFRLVPATPGAPVHEVTMRIASDTTSIQVPVNPDGTFSMPRSQVAIDQNADIFINKKRGSYRWRPFVHTPGLPPNTRRLGDLRLECEVFWAIGHSAAPLPHRALAVPDAAGEPCRTDMLKLVHWAPHPLLEYSLVSGERRQKFTALKTSPAGAPRTYWVPLHDSSWPDDTLIEFVYVPQA